MPLYSAEFAKHLSGLHRYSEHSIRAYTHDIVDFEAWLKRASFTVSDISTKHLRGYITELKNAGYTKTTINRHLSALRLFYNYAVKQQICSSNPAANLPSQKKSGYLPQVLDMSQANELVEAPVLAGSGISLSIQSDTDSTQIGTVGTRNEKGLEAAKLLRDHAIFELMYASGARVAEVAGLTINSLDYSNKSVRLFGKGNKERIVPLYDKALESVRIYAEQARPVLLKNQTATDQLFISNSGLAISTDLIRKIFKTYVKALGLPASTSPHTLRHSFATHVLAGGADLRSVQEMLGHKSPQTTTIYTHLAPEVLSETVKKAHPRG